MTAAAVSIPRSTRFAMFLRLLAIQGSWNYETLLGNGIGFCVEPALRLLPGGRDGEAYRAALARQSQYFNAHPYLASVAVGALARVELEQLEPEQDRPIPHARSADRWAASGTGSSGPPGSRSARSWRCSSSGLGVGRWPRSLHSS